jgi:hypothetical protein
MTHSGGRVRHYEAREPVVVRSDLGWSQLRNRLQLHTLIALLVSVAVAWLLARATWLIVGESRSANMASVRSEQSWAR